MLTKSIHRHALHFTLVLILFGIGYWRGSKGKAELKGELKAMKTEVGTLRVTMHKIAQQPKVNVQNQIEDVKVKDGSQLSFIPETDIQQINVSDPAPEQKAIIPVKNQIKILEKQEQLNRLIKDDRRPKKQRKLLEEIDQLKIPP